MAFGIFLMVGLGLAAIFGAFDGSNDNTDSGTDTDETPDQAVPGQTLHDDGTLSTIEGGEGDDTLTGSDSILGDRSVVVELNGGDDVMTWTGEYGPETFGGAGDDQLYGGRRVFELHGDDGNDTLSGSLLDGGDGDDLLQWISSRYEDSNYSEGGAGNDTLTAESVMGEADPFEVNGGVGLSGGDGNDTFDITLHLANVVHQPDSNDDLIPADPATPVEDNVDISVNDFIKGEDLIDITVDRTIDGVARALTELTFTPVELIAEDGTISYRNTLSMTFAATATQPEVTTHLWIRSDSILTAEDVRLTLV